VGEKIPQNLSVCAFSHAEHNFYIYAFDTGRLKVNILSVCIMYVHDVAMCHVELQELH